MGLFLFVCLASVHSRVVEDHVADAMFKPLVVGGERAGQGRLSFMVSLSLPPAKDKRYHFCGGALIDPTHVLTAAHCLDGSPLEVRIGSSDLGLKEPNSDIIRVKKTFVHPEFDLLTMANDIAIVELERAANAQPVLLSGWVALNPDDRGIVAGWGAVNSEATSFPNAMYDASVPIAPLDQCFRLYGHTLVDTTKICVSVSEGKDTCTGDSGGPLFTVHPSFPDRYVQLGVVSWGSEPCAKTPAVYIRVAYFSEWISSIVPSLGKPINWFDPTNPATFDLLGPSPTPVLQSSAPTPLSVTPFPTRATVPSTALNSPTSPAVAAVPSNDATAPTTAIANTDDCTCTQEADKWGSTCGVHNDDPLGAWCWVKDSCPTAVLTWWGAKFVYCVAPEDVSAEAPPTPFSTPAITEILLAQNWSFGIPDTWRVIDGSTYMGPSVWQANKSVVRQSSNVMNLEPRADLPKLGTYMVYTPGVNQWTDYEMSVNLASTDNDILGVMFRYTNDNNYYRFSMDRQSPTMSRRLVRCENGAFTLLAHDDVPYAIGVFYLLTIIVQQSNIQVLINGQRVFNVVDATFPSGSVALYSWANQDSIFDSVVVSRPGSVATRRLVQPIYGRALFSQTQAQGALDHPERTNEEGDYDFETNSASPQALTIGLVVALLVALGAAAAAYIWKKKKCGSTGSKDIELEVEQGDVECINVVTLRSPLHAAPSSAALDLDLDVQDTCDSPSSRTGLRAPLSPPPLPAWPEGNNSDDNNDNHNAIPDRNLRTPTSRTRKHPRTISLPQSPATYQPSATYQPPVTYSLKKLPSSQRALAVQKGPMSMPRSSRPPSQYLQQEPAPLLENFGEDIPTAQHLTASSSKKRHPPELRQRPPKSPETMMHLSPSCSQPHTSPEIVVPSPMSVTPEPPMFPANDLDALSPPRSQANDKQWIEVSPSRTPSPHRELELSPLPPAAALTREFQGRAQPQQPQATPHDQQPPLEHANNRQPLLSRPPPTSFQHEAWEEIRFDDESDCSDGGVEYFHDR